MGDEFRPGGGAYVRDEDGVWWYATGGRVPQAVDLTLADLLAMSRPTPGSTRTWEQLPVTREHLQWLADHGESFDRVLIAGRKDRVPTCGDVVVGMSAPELQAFAMLTVTDVAELAGVSKATVDSYRYRGSLPEPQSVRGRTPLWSRPVVQAWLAGRNDPVRNDPGRSGADRRSKSNGDTPLGTAAHEPV